MEKKIMINRITLNKNLLKRAWMIVAVCIITAAVLSSIVRSLTPWAKQYKKEIESHLTELIGQPVTIQSMQTGWYWFEPVLKLEHLTVRGEHDSIHLEKLLLGINLFKSLIHWQLEPGVLYLEKSHLVMRQKEGHWHIDGINAGYSENQSSYSNSAQQLLSVLARQERFIIKRFSAQFYFSDGSVIPLREVNFSIVNSSGDYKIKGKAKLDQTISSTFQLLADLSFDPFHVKDTKGHIYFSAKKVVPSQWQNLFSKTKGPIEGGKGGLALWVDLNNGEVSSLQAHVQLNDLAWRPLNSKHTQLIQSFYANLAWKPDTTGWLLQADQVKLKIQDVIWPENKMLVKFNKSDNSYLFNVKSIIIESLLSNETDWPPIFGSLVQAKPHGVLSDFKVTIKNNQPTYLLARFDELGWNAQKNSPAVTNLSGVVQWEPQEGHLELDSENTSVTLSGYPQQNFALLNGVIDWKELSNGLRISIDRFVLSQPELTLSMQGLIDDVSSSSVGNMHLDLDFSAKNIQQWMPYLPKAYMKPKLYFWLTKDLKRVAQATGKITLNGLAKDFPFDNHNGEFTIVSHASGGELFITSKWQLIKDLEGYIRLKNRNLDIDIVNGDFQGVPVKQMNLRIDDIGKDKETLLIHGIINGKAQKMLNFILASPLKEQLIKLKMLSLKGLMLLNAQLEIPLYAENDTNLVKGDLTLKNNTFVVKHQMGSLPIEDVSGNLSFDEKGVTNSALVATVFGYPLTIKIQSEQVPEPITTLRIDGECTIESLKNSFNIPILSLFKGMFYINAALKISAKPDSLDNLVLKTNLQGLAINLPEPLGKSYKEKSPLKVNLDFNSDKALRLRADYNSRLSTDILFEQNHKGALEIKSGQIRLGSAQALDQKKKGLSVVGSLDKLDLKKWKKVMDQFSSEQTRFSAFDKLTSIDLKLNQLTLLQQQFNHLSIKGESLPNHDWSFNIKQKKIEADLRYHASTNLWSGFAAYIHLDKLKQAHSTDSTTSQIKPKQVPNLNFRVDDLSIGAIQIGNVTLKTHSSDDHWFIDYCRIDSPVYQVLIAGDWMQKDKVNQTKMHLKMHVNNLAKSLASWNMTPAVDAKKGDLEFDGGWSGALSDFSLAGLKGDVFLQLKNGRITHLSTETEEKLGLGKLLSILSLQTIPRRLQLDFSDLSHQGYSFDIFKGNFALNKGIMKTQDSYLDGPVAYASMKGDLDIVRRMYDLNLSISPHITASLPIVATIAGGPIVGLAAWVANKIINQSMQRITGYSYKISGPWDQPVVQQLSIVKKLIKK